MVRVVLFNCCVMFSLLSCRRIPFCRDEEPISIIMLSFTIVHTLSCAVAIVKTEIENIDIPPLLYDCLSMSSSLLEFRETKGDTVIGVCLNQFQWINAKYKWNMKVPGNTMLSCMKDDGNGGT